MKLKRTWALAAAIVLSMSLALGTTLAYLTDTDQAVNVMTLGNVDIEQHEYERVTDENGNPVKGVLGEDFTENYGIKESYKLREFTQGKPAYPAVYTNEKKTQAWDEFQQLWNQVGAPGSNDLFDDTMKNVIDKFVFVENTGKSDAYFRTLIAIEMPEVVVEKKLIHTSFNTNSRYDAIKQSDDFTGDADVGTKSYFVDIITLDGVRYGLYNMTHNVALKPGEVARPSLLQLFLDPAATNEDCAAFGDTWEILTLSQAVQVQGFASAQDALNTAFGKVTAETAAEWFKGMVPVKTVTTEAELKEALTANQETITVMLGADVTYDVAAWANDAMGGDTTEDITIYGNGHTITFNQLDSDWNNIVTKNGAKLTIEDANITNAGKNDGPWNRHDLNFACDVELVNVKSDKAMAFKAGAKLTNVTIKDANDSDTYAIWIQPNGQTVELNGVIIDMLECTDGRGIKIDEQYVDAPAKVTLKVADTTFKTEEKSAIIVKSKAGADIILNNVNIEEVVADKINPVWVDEASEAYADLVTVTGGTKIVEGK